MKLHESEERCMAEKDEKPKDKKKSTAEKKPRNVIQLSFKNEGSEYELYQYLKSKLNAAAFVKEVMWDLYRGQPPIIIKGPQDNIETHENKAPAPKVDDVSQTEPVIDYFNEEAERDKIDF